MEDEILDKASSSPQDHCLFSFLLKIPAAVFIPAHTPDRTMFSFLVLAVLCTSCLALPNSFYSYSSPVGGSTGDTFVTEGEGRITGVRLWEVSSAYITGLQLRYGTNWTALIGRTFGNAQELEFHDDEAIIQISGKFSTSYIYQLFIKTSHKRFLMAGQPIQASFNMYAAHPKAELKMLSGRANSNGITSLGAHWGIIY